MNWLRRFFHGLSELKSGKRTEGYLGSGGPYEVRISVDRAANNAERVSLQGIHYDAPGKGTQIVLAKENRLRLIKVVAMGFPLHQLLRGVFSK